MPYVTISNKKCTGCHMCELACSARHEAAYRPSVARLRVEVNPSTILIKGSTCLQAGCAKCLEICPESAIKREVITVTPPTTDSAIGYVLKVDEALCTNCGDCYAVCPYHVIHEHPDRHVAFKCDLCGGDPQCIAFCQNPNVLAVSLRTNKADRELTSSVAG
jgi:Fe-S-cluster-containing hydrogenase component 2